MKEYKISNPKKVENFRHRVEERFDTLEKQALV